MAYRATLKDVAAAAGVSVTTVSLVLNNRPARVSEEKRKAIADAAKKLNYVPNQAVKADIDLCLSNSLGFGGHNATLCVRKYKE